MEAEVKEDLVVQGFHPLKVTRLTRGDEIQKTPLPLMLIQLPWKEK